MTAALGALPAIIAMNRRRRENEQCWDCGHRRIDHRDGCRVDGCECGRFTNTAHVKIGVCRVCAGSVYHDSQTWAMPSDPHGVAEAARAMQKPPVCSEACARLAAMVEIDRPKGWRPGWRSRSG